MLDFDMGKHGDLELEWGYGLLSGRTLRFRKPEWGDRSPSDRSLGVRKPQWGDELPGGQSLGVRKLEWGDGSLWLELGDLETRMGR